MSTPGHRSVAATKESRHASVTARPAGISSTVPSLNRNVTPCSPAAAEVKGLSSWSMVFSERPLTIARAPPRRV